jgi:hypothetical protein
MARRDLVDGAAHRGVARQMGQPLGPARAMGADAFPELAQFADAAAARIASDDRAVDRADRDARDPVGLDLALGQSFVDLA